MAPSKTATKQPQSHPGVSYDGAKQRHRAPWLVTIYHGGTKKRTYHASFLQAVKAKKKAERLQKKEGSRAFAYSREAQVEYDEAKRLVGEDVQLSSIAREFAARLAAGAERKTIEEAVKHYVEAKTALDRSSKHLSDIEERLNIFAASFAGRGLESIRRNELLDWLLGLKSYLKPRSIKNFYRVLSAFFNYAEKRDWLVMNPVRRIDPVTDLPACGKGIVEILTPAAGKAIMRKIEETEPGYIAWACLQYFVGVRDAESEKFRGEWIDAQQKQIRVPGWVLDGKTKMGVAKTRDDWVIHDAPAAFWVWVRRYPRAFAHGPIRHPAWIAWARIRDAVIADGDLTKWPTNGFRHSTATYHLSAYSDPGRTSLLLRHRDAKKLHANYLAELKPKKMALEYLGLQPRPKVAA